MPISASPMRARAVLHPERERRADAAAAVRREHAGVAAAGAGELAVGHQPVAVEDADRVARSRSRPLPVADDVGLLDRRPRRGRPAPGRPAPRRRRRASAVVRGAAVRPAGRSMTPWNQEMADGAAAFPGGPVGGCGAGRCERSGVLDRGDVELELDLLGDEDAAGLERGVPGQAPVLAVEGGRALEADAQVAEGVLGRAGLLEGDGDGLGDALDGQVAGDRPVVAVAGRPRSR